MSADSWNASFMATPDEPRNNLEQFRKELQRYASTLDPQLSSIWSVRFDTLWKDLDRGFDEAALGNQFSLRNAVRCARYLLNEMPVNGKSLEEFEDIVRFVAVIRDERMKIPPSAGALEQAYRFRKMG